MTGHVSGFPVEELLPTLLSGGAAGVLMWCRSLGTRVRSGGGRRPAADGEDQ